MAITFGKLESRITVPTATWTGTLVESVGAESNVFTIAAADYYHSSTGTGAADLAATLQTALDAASDAGANNFNYTVTPSFGEAGTGKTTITFDGTGTFSITWTSTDLRDVFGWTGDVSAVTTTTSQNHARSIWIASRPLVSPWGNGDHGTYETDANSTESNSGHANTLYSDKKRVLSFVEWSDIEAARTRVSNETTTHQSFEKFWLDGILGQATWTSSPGGPLRLTWDAATDATYFQGHCTGQILKSFRPEAVRQGWAGAYRIVVDRLVEVPT